MQNLTDKELAFFSLGRAINQAASGGVKRGTIEHAVLEEFSTSAGLIMQPNRFYLPIDILARDYYRRDMTAAGTSGSNYLVSTDQQAPEDVLREVSAVGALGATILPRLQGNVTIPRAIASVTGGWLSSELDTITGEVPTVGQISMTPKSVAAMITFSHQLNQQSQALDGFLAAHLLGAIGEAIDAAALNGSGSNGEPTGIVNTAGVGSMTGASFDRAAALAGIKALRLAKARPNGWIASPAVAETLQARDSGTDTAAWLWGDDNRIAGVPALAHNSAPASTLILGDWRHLIVGSWGDGVTVEVDPFTAFGTGKTTMRVIATLDVAVAHAGAFAVASSVS